MWRQIQKKNFHSIEELLKFLELDGSGIFFSPRFILNLPRRLAEKIEKGTLNDPILRQFVPLKEETINVPGFTLDPVQDQSFCKTGKILQKYHGRALLLCSSACVMHCRFCFRQNFPYETKVRGFENEIALLEKDSSVEEVILSGGDPLSLSDRLLKELFDAFEKISHIKRVRFHTRFPIGIPERIDDSFLSILNRSSKQIFFAIHCNHPRELDEDVIASLKRVANLGIPILSQTVLLKGVNEHLETMLELCLKLVNSGFLPYYFHMLDHVEGTSHFMVSKNEAISLMQNLQKHLSGYALPRLVKEEPGKGSKTVIY